MTKGKLALGEHRSTEENVAVLGGFRHRSHSPPVDTYATAASFAVAFWHTRSHSPQLT